MYKTPCPNGPQCPLLQDNLHFSTYDHTPAFPSPSQPLPCPYGPTCGLLQVDPSHSLHFIHEVVQKICCYDNCRLLGDADHVRDYKHLSPCPYGSQCLFQSDSDHMSSYSHNLIKKEPEYQASNNPPCPMGGECLLTDPNHNQTYFHPPRSTPPVPQFPTPPNTQNPPPHRASNIPSHPKPYQNPTPTPPRSTSNSVRTSNIPSHTMPPYQNPYSPATPTPPMGTSNTPPSTSANIPYGAGLGSLLQTGASMLSNFAHKTLEFITPEAQKPICNNPHNCQLTKYDVVHKETYMHFCRYGPNCSKQGDRVHAGRFLH